MKILAVLLNPTLDQIYEIENFYIGGTFKVNKSIIYPVGKAISFSLGVRELYAKENILKVIACIGIDDIPLYSKFLASLKIDFDFIEVKGKTRSNKTINDPIKSTTTHIREKGFKLEQKDLEKIAECLRETIEEGDIVILSGSIPPGVDDKTYYEMINLCKEKTAITALDSSGPALINGIKANPNIIKPNLVELSQILDKPELNDISFSDISETCSLIANEAKALLNAELNIILVTLGENGAICITQDKSYYGNVQVDDVIDTVGSGDAFLAGFILNYLLKKEILECFKYAIACGAANTQIPGPGIFLKETVEELMKKVEIIDLS